MESNLIQFCSAKAKVSPHQAEATLKLLMTEECTVPFISRYRKEATGNLNEIQIRDLEKYSSEFLDREKRRSFVLSALEKQGVLTPELKASVNQCETVAQIETLYEPYKAKRKTKAAIARESGLGELADKLLASAEPLSTLESSFTATEKVKTFAEALEGAKDIVIEKISQIPEVRSSLRTLYETKGKIVSEKKKDADKVKDANKFKDYFEFSAPLSYLKSPKASQRFHALVRAKNQNVLKVGIGVEETEALGLITAKAVPNLSELGSKEVVSACIETAYRKSLHPAVEKECMSELKRTADEAAISVFCVNLKNVLLSPYLGSKVVMGIDPGIRTGCKVVVVDGTGKLLCDFVIQLKEEGPKREEAVQAVSKFIEVLNVEYIAIGSGTFGRETLEFIEASIPEVKEGKVKATLISESGASVYSASEAAIEEFPDKDVTVRGAVSIARRFQDPLSELVKIDPKAIGVGQYQHDVNQTKLHQSLNSVVEDCVNYVGVDLNTASYHVLSRISGMGPTLSKHVVEFRDKNGRFKNRKELLGVSRFSDKVFEQAAGFLRIYNGDNPLDATFVHPENMPRIEKWCAAKAVSVQDLVGKQEILDNFAKDTELQSEIGKHTFKDIVDCLKAPSQDPRTHFKSTEFDKSLKTLEDVKVGSWYTGAIQNITHFGAFVDIGIKESGLVHVSQLADRFVEDPLKVVKVGQEVKVRVLEVDLPRKRLSLTCRKEESARPKKKTKKASNKRPPNRRPPKKEKPINPHSPFAILQTLKTKR